MQQTTPLKTLRRNYVIPNPILHFTISEKNYCNENFPREKVVHVEQQNPMSVESKFISVLTEIIQNQLFQQIWVHHILC